MSVNQDPEDKEDLARKPVAQRQPDGGLAAAPRLEASIQAARSSGQPVPDNIRESMEQAFGADFSGVRIHTDARSDRLNRSLHALAFTTGRDIFFRQHLYKPNTRAAQRLIAHELTHVVQQNGRAVQGGQTLTTAAPTIQRFAITDQPIDWNEATAVKVVKGTAIQGVIFVSVDKRFKPGQTLVLKLLSDSGAGALFAEAVLKAAGVDVAHSRIFPANDGGTQILEKLKGLEDLSPGKGQVADHIIQFGSNAKTILVTEMVSGHTLEKLDQAAEGSEETAPLDIGKFLTNPQTARAIGRLIAADAFLGNVDRLSMYVQYEDVRPEYMINLGNLMVTAEGIVKAIDNDTILPGAETFKRLYKNGDTKTWIKGLISGREGVVIDKKRKIFIKGIAGMAPLMMGKDLQVLIEKFKRKISAEYQSNLELKKQLDDIDWNAFSIEVKKGVSDAIKAIMDGLREGGVLQKHYKELKPYQTEEEMYDWSVLELKRQYLELCKATSLSKEQIVDILSGLYDKRGRILAMIRTSIKNIANMDWGPKTQWGLKPTGVKAIKSVVEATGKNDYMALSKAKNEATISAQKTHEDRDKTTQKFYQIVGNIKLREDPNTLKGIVELSKTLESLESIKLELRQ